MPRMNRSLACERQRGEPLQISQTEVRTVASEGEEAQDFRAHESRAMKKKGKEKADPVAEGPLTQAADREAENVFPGRESSVRTRRTEHWREE